MSFSGLRGGKKTKISSSAGKQLILKGNDAGMARGWRGDDAGTSLAQAPRGGTIIKENRFNNNFKQDLTRRWAAGPANFQGFGGGPGPPRTCSTRFREGNLYGF